MRVVSKDLNRGLMKLACESMDDLWHLYNLVEPGNLVGALTSRRDETISDKIRPDRGEKRKMFLTIRVEGVEFHEFTDRLRIHGVIVAGPQDLGSHHTFNLEPDDMVEITKVRWARHHLDRVDEAVRSSKKPKLVVLAIEDDSATLGVLHQYGVRIAAYLGGKAEGKQYKDQGQTGEFFERVLEALRLERLPGMPLIVIGPGFAKEDFLKFVRDRDPDLARGALIEGTGQAGLTGIHEALKSGAVTRAVSDSRVASEVQGVEELLAGIAKDSPVAYGTKEVQEALDRGAVKTLLITDVCVRSGKGEPMMELCRSQGGECMVVSTVHEGGKKLDGLGGVGAILRYALR